MMKVLINLRPRYFLLKGATWKFLQRAIRACLRWAYPLTSLLLVSELNQSFYVGLACASRASETSEPAAWRSHRNVRGKRSDGS